MKRFNEFINEGSETTQVVGSGTKVGGGAVGKYTKAAGVAVGGSDSPSSFSSNSNATNFKSEVPVEPHRVFKEKVKRKKKKDKTERIYNKKGEKLDNLYKKNNENMITKWEEFSKLNEGYLSIGNAVKIEPNHKDGNRIGIIKDRDGDFLTVDLGTHTIKINASSIFDLNADN